MRGRGGGGKCLWGREWTHEGEGRRGANACGGESGLMRGGGEEEGMLVMEGVDT